jgi:hypothetical protein
VRLTTSLLVGAKYFGCVVCRFHAINKLSRASPSQLASTFGSGFFLLLVRLNLGFVLRETCRCAHHTFLLGFPTGWLSTANQDPIGSADIVRHGGKTAPGPHARQNQPPKISHRPASHPSEQPPPEMKHPFLDPLPLHQPRLSSLALRRFPAIVWLGFRCLRCRYRRRTHRRRRTPAARCSSICLASYYG